MLAVMGYKNPGPILIGREYQNSIKNSAFAEVKRAIESEPWLLAHYDIGENYIKGRGPAAGTEFLFRGLHHNAAEVKSITGVRYCWVEEADLVSRNSWDYLTPTIREPGSQIWVTFNPSTDQTATYKTFITDAHKLERALIIKINASDNPWLSEELIEEQRRDSQGDPDAYRNKWYGEPISRSDAQVFAKRWVVEDFEPKQFWNGPYYGLDFGFANDPTTAVRCWIFDNTLYIDYEAGSKKLELDATARYLSERIPGIESHVVRADSARPESISYLKRAGVPGIVGVMKGGGSVEDGVAHIKSYKRIVIHPRCTETTREMHLYSYKTDRLSGDVLPMIIDANNHYIDAIRYAIEPIIIAGGVQRGGTAPAHLGAHGISSRIF